MATVGLYYKYTPTTIEKGDRYKADKSQHQNPPHIRMKFGTITLLTTLVSSMGLGVHATAAAEELQIIVQNEDALTNCAYRTQPGDTISVHYTGSLLDGTIFDSSVKRGTPIQFKLGVGQVIKGWDEGLMEMCIGEKRKLVIPSEMAYGKRGAGGVIPGDATLVFTTELIAVDGIPAAKDEL